MPIALIELACDDKSLVLDLRLGDSDASVTGRSRLDLDWPDWPDWLCGIGGRTYSCLLLDGRMGYSEASRDFAAKGFMNVGVMGVRGVLLGTPGWIRDVIQRAQSFRVYWSSPGRKCNVVGPNSLVVVNPAVRLDLRFRSLSVAGSGDICNMRVGSTGPCFRCAIICTWQSVIDPIECCWTGSQSSFVL